MSAGSDANEPAKLLLPYLQRADELQKHEPLVAYYCRLYAMERGLKFPQNERTKTTNSILISLMNQLEKDKKTVKLSSDDHLHLEGFALNVFAKADKQDRAGRADMTTAKTFYAASIFFEILNQFGEIAPDLEQKQKYAAWKAADIRKALKEGRKPVPGPPGSETDGSTPPAVSSGYDIEPRHTEDDINHGSEPDPMLPEVPSGLIRQTSANIPPSLTNTNILPSPTSTNILPSLPSLPSGDYSSHAADYPSHHYQTGRPEFPAFPQPYSSQSYQQEPQYPQHVAPNYPSHDNATSHYPNFQSYPSFSESSLPAAPSHQPSFNYQGSDASYSHQSGPSVSNYSSAPQYNANSRNGNAPDVSPAAPQYNANSRNGNVPDVSPAAQQYHYDSSYQVPPEKIAEAQKAARFAVGALAFDEVPVAVEHLRKALEYLTNPSAGQ